MSSAIGRRAVPSIVASIEETKAQRKRKVKRQNLRLLPRRVVVDVVYMFFDVIAKVVKVTGCRLDRPSQLLVTQLRWPASTAQSK
jgi:alpha-amylase/alpha-mannosidase (GH57 family)